MRLARTRFPLLGLVIAASVALSGTSALAEARYSLSNLDTLGGNASFALGLNERGEVVGTSRTTSASRRQLAFRWRDGLMTNLGSLPGSTFSRAFEINARGSAVGEAFTPSPERSRAVLWENGRIRDLGALPGASSAVANDINARGQVAGTSGGRAFLWTRGGMRDLGSLGHDPAATSRGNALNDRGQVVGTAQTDTLSPFGSRVSHAFVWERGTMTDLGSPVADRYSTALAISRDGDVAGEANVATVSGCCNDTYHAVLWSDGAIVDLHAWLPAELATVRHSRATDVNSDGGIVGHVSGFFGFPTIDGRAVLWHDGHAHDLNDFLPPDSGWVLRSAEGINERGQIVGYGTFQGHTRAFLLNPGG